MNSVVHRMSLEKNISHGNADNKARERGAAEPFIVKMLITLLAVITMGTPVASSGASVVVGTTPITIPDPRGFTLITPEMRSVFELQKEALPQNIVQFGAYIPVSQVQTALDAAGFPNLDRRFDVGAARKSLDRDFTLAEFPQLKVMIKTQNEDLVNKVKQQLPHFMENLNSYVARGSGIDNAFSVMDVITLPPHEETARSISYSLFEKFNVKNNSGTPTAHVAVATMTFLYVNGKILILHCYAEPEALAWSRTALKQWADAIVAANATFESGARAH
jgi:hypothetical protein